MGNYALCGAELRELPTHRTDPGDAWPTPLAEVRKANVASSLAALRYVYI